ncbi:MAG: hypothetical protein SFY66_03560 [Oculatellaceae cyanobacterium bins.114]|nr:hypothetical protein [Oculatellaceae cyanobacterium bins.114]
MSQLDQVVVLSFYFKQVLMSIHQGAHGETALILAREYDPNKGFEEELLNQAIREMKSLLEEAM